MDFKAFREKARQQAASKSPVEIPKAPESAEEFVANQVTEEEAKRSPAVNSFLARLKSKTPAPAPAPTQAKDQALTMLDDIEGTDPKPKSSLPWMDKAKQTETVELPLNNVITAANLVSQGVMAEDKEKEVKSVSTDNGATLEFIRQKIHELQMMEGLDLKSAMKDLREVLLTNADACSLMLPEDLQLMTRALRKMTNNKVAADMAAARPRKQAAKTEKPVALTPEEMAAIQSEF
ncbi:hypothetical protein PaMx41_ORF40 [Pseudomonas phage PaMx41]|uniref:Uncharacterized protein n=1 Tax=Pseudomonas phage PaMx41 TaxID=1815976 RepID=A0A1C8HQ54_BPPP4|nr:hypothetical protein KNT55_gp41 [Pseudomonas phage PaMx41]ANA49003.1 hypothetical protein PaMx41_ORF40 [Pseudomonas phage PaMx41]